MSQVSTQAEMLELFEQFLGPPDGLDVPAHQLFSSRSSFGHQLGSFQYRHVLLHRGETHRVALRQRAHRVVAPQGELHDVAPGGVGERVEQQIDALVGGEFVSVIYNHLVVR